MKKITIAHGSGGKITHNLIKDIFFKHMGNGLLEKGDDSAIVNITTGRIAVTTDSFVVKPLFFPGGDIGKLSICGTVNDLSVSGAVPKYITCGFIIEEGFLEDDLEKIVQSMAFWSQKAGVKIIAGDTKVVERNAADGVFINTSGVGILTHEHTLGIERIKSNDKIIITGTIADHGLAVLSKRKGLEFESQICSDCAPLNNMLMDVLNTTGDIRFMRDPTRGGLATTLNEVTESGNFGITIYEDKIPISENVRGACELLGLDPVYIANEGKALLIVEPDSENRVLSVLRGNEYGKDAATIGVVTEQNVNKVCMRTRYGVMRIMDMLSAEPLPRIC